MPDDVQMLQEKNNVGRKGEAKNVCVEAASVELNQNEVRNLFTISRVTLFWSMKKHSEAN